jgi:hypothetical protein
MRRWVKGFCARSEAVRDVRVRFDVEMGSTPVAVAKSLFDWSNGMFGGGVERMVECAAMVLMWGSPQIGLFQSLG